jgi:hypothetical protein
MIKYLKEYIRYRVVYRVYLKAQRQLGGFVPLHDPYVCFVSRLYPKSSWAVWKEVLAPTLRAIPLNLMARIIYIEAKKCVK